MDDSAELQEAVEGTDRPIQFNEKRKSQRLNFFTCVKVNKIKEKTNLPNLTKVKHNRPVMFNSHNTIFCDKSFFFLKDTFSILHQLND